MLLILLTWIYMLFIFSVQGEYINKLLFKGKLDSIGITTLLGMIFQAISVTIVAFFYRIHIEYFCCNTFLTIVLTFLNKDSYFLRLRKNLHWSRFSVILFILIVTASLLRSSLLPFLIDNDTYYIQTIKWLNEYGWVKGLANLHLFLIHGSPWHALQAAYNFHFISDVFNDINGFLVCVMGFLWINKMNGVRRKNDYQTNRWLFFLPVFAVLWFQFVDAPSVDLPLFLITLLIVYYFLNRSEETDLLAIFLLVFLVFIKVSIAPVLLLLFFFVNKKNIREAIFYTLPLGLIYMFKGVWLGGCPLSPYTGFSLPVLWALPKAPNFDYQFFSAMDLFDFRHIGSNDLLDIVFAFILVSTLVIYGRIIWKEKKQYPIFLLFVLEIIWVLSALAQMRFILPASFYPMAYILSKIRLSSRLISVMICFFISLVFIPIFIRFDYKKWIEKSSHLLKVDTFQTEYVFKPAGISKHRDLTFKKIYFTNFHYYGPEDQTEFLFLTGNGPIPCVKTDYLYRMYLSTDCVPALIGDDLSDGFYSAKIK